MKRKARESVDVMLEIVDDYKVNLIHFSTNTYSIIGLIKNLRASAFRPSLAPQPLLDFFIQ